MGIKLLLHGINLKQKFQIKESDECVFVWCDKIRIPKKIVKYVGTFYYLIIYFDIVMWTNM